MFKWRKMLTTALAAAFIVPLRTSSPASTANAATGSFDVLSYNIGELPDILSSSEDPETYTPIIGSKLGPYEIVNVQEDNREEPNGHEME